MTRDRRWTLCFAALVMLLTTLPYLVGFHAQGSGWRFTGFVFAVDDGNSYIAKMLSGSAGAWLFRTPYTAQPQRGVLAFLPYILLGKLAAPPAEHEQLVALFHLFRIIAGLLAILATADFLALFLKDLRWRRLALVVVILGGGLGWLLALFTRSGQIQLEFYSPESFGFLALYGLPHLALARALLLWGLVAYLSPQGLNPMDRGAQFRIADHLKSGVQTGLLWLGLGLAQPLTVVVGWAVLAAHLAGLGLWQIWRSRRGQAVSWCNWKSFLVRAAAAVILSSPIVLYTLLAFQSDPFLRDWLGQNLILSPPFWHYLLAYGLLLPCAVLGGLRLVHSDPQRGWLLVAWALLLPFLAYAPYNLQRRLPEGVWVALVVLAAVRLEGLESREPFKPRRLAWLLSVAVAIALLMPSTIMLMAGGFMAAARPAWPAFHPADETAGFETLANQAQAGQVVLAGYQTGNVLPAWAPLRVVIGHGPESAGLEALRPQVRDFFNPLTSDRQRIDFLQAQGVNYVFWGPSERELGAWNPHLAGFLQVIYNQGDYSIFRVR